MFTKSVLWGIAVSGWLPFTDAHAAEPAKPDDLAQQPLRERLKDEHALGADHWIYNDFAKAVEEAKKSNRPIFVTFRCVPCKACASFDAEVAKGSDLIKSLAKSSFVSLRQVEMKGVDLSQFQFDYDLNWAAMFINADGTVYGRYGTQSADGPDAFNSVASLEKAMLRVLKLHAEYPQNAVALAGKRGPTKPYRTALDMPGLKNKEALRGPTQRGNCIHCHNLHDAEQNQALETGGSNQEFTYRWPLPNNVGLHIDPKDGCLIERVQPDSAAAKAGLRAGDAITHANGQAIISIADIQWVLHNLPKDKATVTLTVSRNGDVTRFPVQLTAGWKQSDIAWRGSMWSLRPNLGFWTEPLKAEQLSDKNLPPDTRAVFIKYINAKEPEGRAAAEAGLKNGDIILAIADQPLPPKPQQIHTNIRLNYRAGDKLPLTLWRDGKKARVELPLVQ